MSPARRTRFAPSPTGYLHLGHVASALYVWGVAAAREAAVLLRIEDHDRGRCRPEYERAIFEDLAWLGLVPANLDADWRPGHAPYRQADRTAAYEAALATLAARGLVYACDCSRKTIEASMAARGLAGAEELRYAGTCRARGLPLDRPDTGLRVALPDEVVRFDDLHLGAQAQRPAHQCGDLLARDRQGNWTYQFAVTVDDLEQRIDLVVRGQDLTASTGRQILLARLLGRAEPPRYYHHPLITDASGQKLGKRFFSEAIGARRAAGETPEAIIGEAARLVGLGVREGPVTLAEAVEVVGRV